MQEIKFRAIIKEKNVIEYFTLQDLLTNNLFTMREFVKPWLRAGNLPDRFTGFKDKNAKEIYEDDIVKYKGVRLDDGYLDKSIKGVAKVYYTGSGFYVDDNHLDACDEIEIISNIHENPELLSETSK